MDLLVDLLIELHSILRTRLPYAWDFVDLTHNKDLSIVLNNLIYFAFYIAFLVWFVKVLILRIEDTSGNRLEVKDRCLIAVVSMVPAMHILWPFLLTLTHMLTCSYYPWVTAAVVLLLDISLFSASLKRICSDIFSAILHFPKYVIRRLSLEWLTTSRLFHSSPELTPATGRTECGEVVVGPSSTPVIQPRFTEEDEYRPSGAHVIQPKIAPDEHTKPSQEPVIQTQKAAEETYRPSETPENRPQLTPRKSHGSSQAAVRKSQKAAVCEETYRLSERPNIQPHLTPGKPHGTTKTRVIQPCKTSNETYRPSETPKIQPHLTLEKFHGPSETPILQPRVDFAAFHKASAVPKIQPRLGHLKSKRDSETPRIYPQKDFRKPYRELEDPKMRPLSLGFVTTEAGFSEDSGASTSKKRAVGIPRVQEY